MNQTVDAFRDTLRKALSDSNKTFALANVDLDTGHRDVLGEYELADQAYAQLLGRLTAKRERSIPGDLKKHMLDFFASAAGPTERSDQTSNQLSILKDMKVGGVGE